MEINDWKAKHVEYVKQKNCSVAAVRHMCTAQQLATLDALMKALRDFDWDFNETITAAGSTEDMSIGSFTRVLTAYSSFQMYWKEAELPDFYDDVMESQETEEEIRGFDSLMDDFDALIDSVRPEKKTCVSCGKDLVGRQKKLCGKKKCKDKYHAKK